MISPVRPSIDQDSQKKNQVFYLYETNLDNMLRF
jgi:hypothetical protein